MVAIRGRAGTGQLGDKLFYLHVINKMKEMGKKRDRESFLEMPGWRVG